MKRERHMERCALVAGLVVACAFISGCGQSTTAPDRPETEKVLQQLMSVANRYQRANNNQLPPNEAAFKKFAQNLKPADLESMGITDINKIFISPRDNQPFVIRYGVSNPGMTGNPKSAGPSSAPPVFAYEKTGAGGKRWVIIAQGGSAMEVDDETLKRMVPEAK